MILDLVNGIEEGQHLAIGMLTRPEEPADPEQGACAGAVSQTNTAAGT